MLIKGVRSFSPNNQGVIEFYKPLTLIVGHNGAGKTTVIECLKQACTGELPPNVKSGQSFIHDPKVAGETEVKAQIKLRIRTAAGTPVVIIRAFQLTQKKTALQFKALDQTLQTHDKDGVKQALSYRCADIDRIVPGLMGVSKAILENVIFVHQEDSNWPLADGQTLKRNFDDIFSATKYTKALEALRKLRTEKVQEAKEMKLKLEHLKTHKDNADQLRQEIQEGKAKEETASAAINALEEQLQARKAAFADMRDTLEKMDKMGEERAKLQTQLDVLTQQNSETYARIIAKYGAEEVDSIQIGELEQWMADLDQQTSEWQTDLNRVVQEIKGLEYSITSIRNLCEKDMQQKASLTAAAEAHGRAVEDRNNLVKEVAATCGMADLAGIAALSDADLPRFNAAFEERMRASEGQLATLKQRNAQSDDEAGRRVDHATGEISAAKEGVRAKQDTVQRNEKRQQQLQSEMLECAISAEMVEDVKGRESAAKGTLESKRSRLAKLGADRQLQELAANLRQTASRISTLRQERDQLLAQSEEATRARLKQQDLRQKEQQAAALLSQCSTRLARLLNVNATALPKADKVRAAVDNALERCQEGCEEAAAQLRQAQNEASSQQGTLTAAKAQLAKQERQLADSQRELQQGLLNALGKDEPPDVLADRTNACEHQCDEARTAKARLSATNVQVDFFKKQAMERKECSTCGRALTTAADMQRFMTRQDNTLKSIPRMLAQTEQAIAAAQQQLDKLRGLQPAWLRFEALQTQEIPGTKARIGDLDATILRLNQRVQQLQEACNSKEQDLQEARALKTDFALELDRLAREIATRKRELAPAVQESTGASRSIDEIDVDLEGAEAERNRLEQSRDELQRKESRQKDDVAQATAELHRVGRELLEATQQADKHASKLREVHSLEQHNSELLEQMGQLRSSISSLEARRNQLTKEREGMRADMRAREAEAEAQVRGLAAQRSQLDSKQQPVDHYVSSGGAQRLQEVTQRLVGSREKLQEKESLHKDRKAREAELDKSLKSQDATKFQLEDTLAFKRGQQVQEQYAAQLQEVLGKIQALGDYPKLLAEYTSTRDKISVMQRDQDMKRGGQDSIREAIQRAKRSLSAAQYLDIDAKYGMQQIELRTTEMATSDLEKYHKALEKALLAFHTSKMADINKIIKELWQKTYRNQDIDYIQIKADADGARSYNYRVVMMAGGASLDMRGRCSAGQKVLACLIIRLALAETFCLNCGILALDEPTTNLDAANAASLAEALRQIMEARRAQSNFQLVVITHDERFAHMIGTREHAEYMWRITKDDNQHSHISREPLSD